MFGSTGGGVVNTGDNSLASDFSREGLGNIDTDEVDPIAEAEVYLAYGRDAQAEEILKDALKKDPQRQEIYLKLLEIHAQHNKPSAFETVASELYSVSGGQGEVWQKAMALGRQLDPANPLFTEAGGAAFAAAPAAAAAVVAATEAPPSDTQVFSVPPEHKAEPRVATPLDFSLDDDISLSPSSGEEPKTPAAILAGAAQEVAKSSRAASDSFDKSSAFPGTVSGAAAAKSGASDKFAPVHDSLSLDPESVPKFDLDFHLDEPVRAAPSAAQPKPAPAPEPERAFATAGAPAPQLARPAAAIELDKLDLAFDPDRSTFEDPTPSVLDGQWHDAATKLDLAKAYQEMGDVEGAREILQEVLHEGDDEQKTEAQVAAVEARLGPSRRGKKRRQRMPPFSLLTRRVWYRVGSMMVTSLAGVRCESLSASNTTARPFTAGRRRPTAAACRTRSSARYPQSPLRPLSTVAAGRTDAGVHAAIQVVHFDTDARRADTAWVRGVNALLPASVAVRWAVEVAGGIPRPLRRDRPALHLSAARSAGAAGAARGPRRLVPSAARARPDAGRR